eukprot:TRINITY_DN1604_c0_g2_i1.p1 TRINITY_DN1604_c0_g2~~TRINITY_DN1604_c0_g2_i1.p1  ORF type:complete len:402 (-),score=125.61 TRINITY_DN1604_c0_g2_i1:908-2002(-)
MRRQRQSKQSCSILLALLLAPCLLQPCQALMLNHQPVAQARRRHGAPRRAMASQGFAAMEQDFLEGATQTKRVFVCTNRWCKERGSGATLSSFVGLAPEDEVLVQGVNCLGRCNKGPNLRVLQEDGTWLEFNRIDSVERVYKILRDFLSVGVSRTAAECLKYNFQGNSHLDKNEVTEAIECYNKAISMGWADQEGVLLVMRATAYLQRAYSHRRALTALLSRVARDMPGTGTLEIIHKVAPSNPRAALMLVDRLAAYCREKETLYQTTKFRYGLYEIALLRACNDALRATQLLPDYAKCWLRAGDALAELRRFSEAADYYEVALELDPQLAETLAPTIQWLRTASAGGEGDAAVTDAALVLSLA